MNILLVDDDEVDRLAITRALRSAGVDATLEEADSVSAAAAALQSRTFDCVLADYQLAPGDGLDVLDQVRQAGLATPVVILTGHGSEQTAVELMKAGATDYLPKSALSGDRLVQSVRYAIERRKLEQDRDRLRVREQAAREEAVGVWGWWALRSIPIDAIPDRAFVAYGVAYAQAYGMSPGGLRRGIPSSASLAAILFPWLAGLTCLSTCRTFPSMPM